MEYAPANRDSSTRFQLPKISSAGLTEQIRAETEESLLESEFDTESCSEAARDSGALLSDLLDRLEEAAAISPEPRSQASVAFAAEHYAQSDFNTDPAAEDKRLDFLQALQPWPGSTEENPVSGVETTGGFTLSQSYRVLLERFPSNITDESGSKKQDTRESQVGKDSRSDPKNENTSPVTPQPKRRKKKDLTPTLSPFLFGPFPTPTAHRQFINTPPSQSLSSQNSSSPCQPTSPTPQPQLSLKRRSTKRSRLHLSDLFKQRQGSN